MTISLHVVRDIPFCLMGAFAILGCAAASPGKAAAPLAAAMAASLQNGHGFDPGLEQRILDRIQLGWLENRFNFEHKTMPRLTA